MFRTPILFLVFNRPSSTAKVFEQIRKAAPRQLFIAADGPRKHFFEDEQKCQLTRDIINKVDWECEVKTLFRTTNLGCKQAVSSAINWFFEYVDEGIILEDDTLPDLSFFTYCESLLHYYRSNDRIMHINGINVQFSNKKYSDSYYFSKYAHVWGWATWKRAWNNYDIDLGDYLNFIQRNGLQDIVQSKKEYQYWVSYFEQVKYDKIDTWDIQWLYSIWQNDGLCITPTINLVKNIGFGVDATHTIQDAGVLSNLFTSSLTKINHPKNLILNRKADKRTFTSAFNPSISFANRIRNICYRYIPMNVYSRAKLIKEKVFKLI